MKCTGCNNTVPISEGASPRYSQPTSKNYEPLCRICWEKATEPCQEHKQLPDPHGTRGCYGPLFTCPRCSRRVCAGYGGAPDPRCDTCISEPEDD